MIYNLLNLNKCEYDKTYWVSDWIYITSTGLKFILNSNCPCDIIINWSVSNNIIYKTNLYHSNGDVFELKIPVIAPFVQIILQNLSIGCTWSTIGFNTY